MEEYRSHCRNRAWSCDDSSPTHSETHTRMTADGTEVIQNAHDEQRTHPKIRRLGPSQELCTSLHRPDLYGSGFESRTVPLNGGGTLSLCSTDTSQPDRK